MTDHPGRSLEGKEAKTSERTLVWAPSNRSPARGALARFVERVAAIYVPSHRVRLMAREDRFNRGSDHSSFTNAGYPAIVFREANENFAKQHSADDPIDGVDFKYLAHG